jgi:hypothetical protein
VAKVVFDVGAVVERGAFRWSPGGEALMVSPGILCKRRGSCVGIGVGVFAAPEFRIWSPTTLLGQALSSLTTVDRTGNGAFC